MGLMCFVFFAGIAVVSNIVVPNKTTTWWTTSIFVGFALLSAPMILDYFMAKHQVAEDGLTYRKLVGTRKYLRWSDLRDVRYVPVLKWFRLGSCGCAPTRQAQHAANRAQAPNVAHSDQTPDAQDNLFFPLDPDA